MKLQTQIPLNTQENQIDYHGRLLLLGSCFSQHIGKKFKYFKYQLEQNPFGILYHPKAIENLISRAVAKKFYSEKDVFFLNARWHCFDAHSELSDVSKEVLLVKLNEGLKRTKQQIIDSSHVIITFGSSWVYRHLEQNRVVSNCHKEAQSKFKKELLNIEAIVDCLNTIINRLQSVNNKVQIIFTISPVRHLKDGFVENQRSKAHLISAIHNLLSFRAQSRNISYFPSYELMMDELRDYRFYEADMVHPNQLAIDYIWEKFERVWISEEVYPIMGKVDEVQKGLRHKPFSPNSDSHRRFEKSLREKITYLKEAYPFMQFDERDLT